ncbi:Piso0_001943 [Millerozyma farinosa CBS 7064]|uniref:Piso0_001943 protein n=1 Tax=Pichia sorbitophila (strain ATCC MYA-4447 / BCRC 22081 / CBS 7064 / NBRC 10061 / NRRL Y-12695) TaxID=559304 RepID=G8YB99_PICSO|nr:Piso0_001943 [Millerozyma farinosa CBS 7064]
MQAIGRRRSKRFALNGTDTYKENSDSEDSASYSEAEESDEEFELSTKKRGKRSVNSENKRRHSSKENVAPIDFEENRYYQALSHPDISVMDLALEWIDEYTSHRDKGQEATSLADLINLILRCCGCYCLLQPHDLANIDSAAETVSELAIAFEKQKSHEFPFVSNNKELKFFRKNILEFFSNIVQLSHEKGLLYSTGSEDADADAEEEMDHSSEASSMNKILVWLSCLCTSNIRPLRYVSTAILLELQTKLCEVISSISNALEKNQRQLSNIKSSKNGRSNRSTQNKKADIVYKNVAMYHKQKEIIKDYFSEITETTFIHRYRDIDPMVRQECLQKLGEWMVLYPDFFFQSSYLRYFGWLLSDPSSSVRGEIAKALLKLYKTSSVSDNSMSLGFRQFTERFKSQMIQMIMKDTDFNVKSSLIQVSCELFKIGFLDSTDVEQVTSYFFYIVDNGSSFGVANEEKLKLLLAKFVSMVNEQYTHNERDHLSLILNAYSCEQFEDTPGKLNFEECLRLKNLISILSSTYRKYNSDKDDKNSSSDQTYDLPLVAKVFRYLSQVPPYLGAWEVIVKHLLLDFSSLRFVSKSDQQEKEISELHELRGAIEPQDPFSFTILLNCLCGSLSVILSNKKNTKAAPELPKADDVLVKLANYFPRIITKCFNSSNNALLFVHIWNIALSSTTDSNICTTYHRTGQLTTYNDISTKILRLCKDHDFIHDQNDTATIIFDHYFKIILNEQDSDRSESSKESSLFTTADLRLGIQNLCIGLSAQIKQDLKRIEDQIPDSSVEETTAIIASFKSLAASFLKVNTLGSHLNINPYLSDINKEESLLISLFNEIQNKINLESFIKASAKEFLTNFDDLFLIYSVFLDTVLVSYSWKLEELVSSTKELVNIQGTHDIELIFSDLNPIFQHIQTFFGTVSNMLKYAFAYSGSSHFNLEASQEYLLLNKLKLLRTLFAAKFIDLLVSIKIFYIKFKDNNGFANFGSFFNSNFEVIKLIENKLPVATQKMLLDVFLDKEAKVAKFNGLNLDRFDDEDVNFEEIQDDEDIEEALSDNLSDSQKDDNISKIEAKKVLSLSINEKKKETISWNLEKDMCVYAIKLLSLVQIHMVDKFVFKRLRLNYEKMGGLFQQIIEQNIKQLNDTNANINDEESSISSYENAIQEPSTDPTQYSNLE